MWNNPFPATRIGLDKISLFRQCLDIRPLFEFDQNDIRGKIRSFSKKETVKPALVIGHFIFQGYKGIMDPAQFKQVPDPRQAVLPGYEFRGTGISSQPGL